MPRTARMGNVFGRQGRVNPGREHLAGADVTAKMQRQYEDILRSSRKYHRYGSDAKRKQVAAATVRAMAQHNPNGEERARRLTEDFHGREPREVLELIETEYYDEWVSILGFLEELNILTDDGDYAVPIRFKYGKNDPDSVLMVAPDLYNIEFLGGDQDIEWQQIDGATEEAKNLVSVGPVLTIAYWADKHHLSGPKSQASGTPYEHEFGEEGGELPYLVFDRRNQRMLLVGGDYIITPEGIRN
jgi:hypothetical protein